MVIDWNLITFVTALCIAVSITSFMFGYMKGEYKGWCDGRREINCYIKRGSSVWREERLKGVRK